jgi:hypothetical protein
VPSSAVRSFGSIENATRVQPPPLGSDAPVTDERRAEDAELDARDDEGA